MMARGKFITVEGIEGVGKSTNIDHLSAIIEAHGFEVLRTREPGGTPMAERIRQMLLEHGEEDLPDIAELLLFFASRSLHIRNAICPALEAGKWVVCDRFTDASRAYQGNGRGLDMQRINMLAEWVQDGLEPDLTILLDASAEIGMQRAQQRGEADRLESEQQSFYQRVRQGYLDLAAAHPQRFVVLDASGSMAEVRAEVERVTAQLISDN
ncbi:MAG: dTMP kinase [Woeseiaceae bacterium]|jgi:dTMP kinase